MCRTNAEVLSISPDFAVLELSQERAQFNLEFRKETQYTPREPKISKNSFSSKAFNRGGLWNIDILLRNISCCVYNIQNTHLASGIREVKYLSSGIRNVSVRRKKWRRNSSLFTATERGLCVSPISCFSTRLSTSTNPRWFEVTD